MSSGYIGRSAPELRKDPVLNRWVLIAGTADPTDSAPPDRAVDATAAACAVCARVDRLEPGARVGTVPPLHPLLDRRAVVDRSRSADELYMTMTGSGEHELLVESREHGVTLAELSADHLTEILILYRERLLFLRQDNRFRFMTIVKTASAHASSHAFALPLVPQEMKDKLVGIQGYNRRTGSCVYCDTIKHERADKTRKIAETMRHVALAPFASRAPFEMIFFPKGHHSDYAMSSDQDLADLAALFSEALRRLDRVAPEVHFRMTLETAPPEMGADLQKFHWHFELVPAIGAAQKIAGIEVNTLSPEESARRLREAVL